MVYLQVKDAVRSISHLSIQSIQGIGECEGYESNGSTPFAHEPSLSPVKETEEKILHWTLAPIQEQLKQMNGALSGELRDLDRLYTASDGQYAQLLGRAPDGLRGEDAIEAEYLNRMEDIMEKFNPCVVFKPLSLSIVRCKARIRKKGKAAEITLPFVDNSFRIE